jgi:enoyl-CoA hydratase
MSEILIDRPIDGVQRLTLNRPDAMNAFTFAMYSKLLDILQALRHDAQTRVVILTGSGKVFCAGHDLRNAGSAPWVQDETVGKAYLNRMVVSEINRIPVAMRQAPQPIICAVNGTTAGVGYALALAADLCIAARSAKFVNAFHNAGTGHELGVSYMLPRAVGTQRAAEILLSNRAVFAEEAAQIGMVLRCVPDDQLGDVALELARGILANVPLGVAITKQSLWMNQSAGSLEAAIELESRGVMIAASTADAAEKRKAFFEKRGPKFTGQ